MQKQKRNELLYILALSLFFCVPYLANNLLQTGHDTLFHLGRIEALSTAFLNHDFFVSIFPFQNNGYGYASPLFYSNLFLYPAGLLHMLHVPLTTCYKLTIFLFTFWTGCSLNRLLHQTKCDPLWAKILILLYLCNPYRITNVYVRGAIGEVFAMAFFPYLLLSFDRYQHHEKHAQFYLVLSIVGLMLSHNISFLFGMILTTIFGIYFLAHKEKQVFQSMFWGLVIAFGLTIFYSFPLLEQLKTQSYIVDYYATHGSLLDSAMHKNTYLNFHTAYGYGPNSPYGRMVLNTGPFLMGLPLCYLFFQKKPYLNFLWILSYFFLIFPSWIFPWNHMGALSVIQFPWRFLLIVGILETYLLAYLHKDFKKPTKLVIFALGLVFSMVSLFPTMQKPFMDASLVIDSSTTWQELQEGKLINPYQQATYNRLDLAGGDYLPIDSLDFRSLPKGILNASLEPTGIPYEMDYHALTFQIDSSMKGLYLPKTYYKGYQLINSSTQEKIPLSSKHGLCYVASLKPGTYVCTYQKTILQYATGIISILVLAWYMTYLKKQSKDSI